MLWFLSSFVLEIKFQNADHLPPPPSKKGLVEAESYKFDQNPTSIKILLGLKYQAL